MATTNDPNCGLTPTSSVPWIVFPSAPPAGTAGSVLYVAQANSGASRLGTLTLGSQTITVTQSAGPPPTQNWQQLFPAIARQPRIPWRLTIQHGK